VLAHGHYFNLKNYLQLKSASARLIAALVLFLAVGARAETNDSVGAIIQGRKLALHLLEQRPTENLTQAGVLKIRDAEGHHLEIPMKCEIVVTPTNWLSIYETIDTNGAETMVISHSLNQPPQLEGDFPSSGGRQYIIGLRDAPLGTPNGYSFQGIAHGLAIQELLQEHLIPFAHSDFWLCDLGLEFFHWPAQKILPKTTNLKRGREYTLLESTNPNPATNGYSRVLSWIDKESGGILEAEAYDAQGKLLKEFEPKSFKKINGQWELSEMEIRNVQTDSRTRLEFDLKSN